MAIQTVTCPKCLASVERDDRWPLNLLDPSRDKVKHPQALHICAGKPANVDAVRRNVAGSSPASGNVATVLCAHVVWLKQLGISTTVADQDALIPVLAADMERKSQAKGEAVQSKASWESAAKQQIEGNRTTALTTSDDRYTAINGGAAFDELHELIHILSGPGGESSLHNFKLQVNEGAINYFSELSAPTAGVAIVARYQQETSIVSRLVRLIDLSPPPGADGRTKLYDATFKGQVDSFFDAIGTAFATQPTLPNGKPKGFSDKKLDPGAAKTEFQSKLQNWSLSWLEPRLPAAI